MCIQYEHRKSKQSALTAGKVETQTLQSLNLSSMTVTVLSMLKIQKIQKKSFGVPHFLLLIIYCPCRGVKRGK